MLLIMKSPSSWQINTCIANGLTKIGAMILLLSLSKSQRNSISSSNTTLNRKVMKCQRKHHMIKIVMMMSIRSPSKNKDLVNLLKIQQELLLQLYNNSKLPTLQLVDWTFSTLMQPLLKGIRMISSKEVEMTDLVTSAKHLLVKLQIRLVFQITWRSRPSIFKTSTKCIRLILILQMISIVPSTAFISVVNKSRIASFQWLTLEVILNTNMLAISIMPEVLVVAWIRDNNSSSSSIHLDRWWAVWHLLKTNSVICHNHSLIKQAVDLEASNQHQWITINPRKTCHLTTITEASVGSNQQATLQTITLALYLKMVLSIWATLEEMLPKTTTMVLISLVDQH